MRKKEKFDEKIVNFFRYYPEKDAHKLGQEVISLDLRNQSITLGELLANPKSKAVLQRRFGALLSHPMVGMAKKLSLKQLIAKAGGKLSPQVIQETLAELESL